MKAQITGIEMFHKTLDEGRAGDQCGVMLKGVKRADILRGQVLCAPTSVKTHSAFDADIYVLKEDEGGRKKPFFTNYRPQAFIRTGTVTVDVTLPANARQQAHRQRIIDSSEEICALKGRLTAAAATKMLAKKILERQVQEELENQREAAIAHLEDERLKKEEEAFWQNLIKE